MKSRRNGKSISEIIENYKKNPKLCKICNCIIDYKKNIEKLVLIHVG